jgi:hypothetical protein
MRAVGVREFGGPEVLAAGAFGGYVVQLAHADGSVQGDLLVPALADGGRIATVRGYAGPEGGSGRGITWLPVFVRDDAENRAALDRLREQAETGELTPRVADELPAERAGEAHARLEAGGVRGRLVLVLSGLGGAAPAFSG